MWWRHCLVRAGVLEWHASFLGEFLGAGQVSAKHGQELFFCHMSAVDAVGSGERTEHGQERPPSI